MTNSAAGSDVGGDARFSPPGIIRFGEAYRHVETASRLSWNPLCAQPGNLLRPSAVGPRNGRARFRRLACSKNAGLAASTPRLVKSSDKTPDGARSHSAKQRSRTREEGVRTGRCCQTGVFAARNPPIAAHASNHPSLPNARQPKAPARIPRTGALHPENIPVEGPLSGRYLYWLGCFAKKSKRGGSSRMRWRASVISPALHSSSMFSKS